MKDYRYYLEKCMLRYEHCLPGGRGIDRIKIGDQLIILAKII